MFNYSCTKPNIIGPGGGGGALKYRGELHPRYVFRG